MFLGLLTLITALTISAVAIYYSVAGLVAIFAAAAVPIIIMGGTLEVAKLVTAVWLHKHWGRAVWWLKSYLTIAVVVLMFITSMGIFGFLSKAHIEQTSASEESVSQIERIDSEVARLEAVIDRAEDKIESVQNQGTGADANLQAQIDREQERIDGAYDRVQPLIDEQNAIIDSKTRLFQDQVDKIDQDLALLQSYIDNGEIRKAQGMVGTRADGAYGPATAEAFRSYQESKQQERAELVQRVFDLSQDPTVQAARDEIRRLRAQAEQQIERSNELVNRLRSQLGTDTGEDINAVIDEQNGRITDANQKIDALIQEKFQLEAKFRALEAEVGPIKYIAEFVYGDQADKNMLEEAVRWVIIIIIFVFDPLAVLLLIASQYTFKWYNEEREHEDAKEKGDESNGTDGPEDPDGNGPPTGTGSGSEKSIPEEQGADIENYAPNWKKPLTQEEINKDLTDWDSATHNETQGLTEDLVFSEEYPVSKEERDVLHVEEDNADADAALRDMVSDNILPDDEMAEPDVESHQVQSDEGSKIEEWNRLIEEAERVASQEEEDQEIENAPESHKDAMKQWKADNPDSSLKLQRRLLNAGKIDELPWLKYLEPEADFQQDEDPDAVEAAKWAQEQIEKSKKKDSDLDRETGHEPDQTIKGNLSGYIQNEEQNQETIWERIKRES